MDLKRGDIVTVAVRGPYTGKPRPALVVQESAYLHTHDSVTVCPITTALVGSPAFRIDVAADAETGLHAASQVMVDKIVTIPRRSIRSTGGRAPDVTFTRAGQGSLAATSACWTR